MHEVVPGLRAVLKRVYAIAAGQIAADSKVPCRTKSRHCPWACSGCTGTGNSTVIPWEVTVWFEAFCVQGHLLLTPEVTASLVEEVRRRHGGWAVYGRITCLLL